MYLRNKSNQDMVEVLDVKELIDPTQKNVAGRYHAGEELQEQANFSKDNLVFPSGEALPRCWTDADYQA